MEADRRAHFEKLAKERYDFERGMAAKRQVSDGEVEGLCLAVLELLRETQPTPPIPDRWLELWGRGINAREAHRRGLYGDVAGQLGEDLVEAIDLLIAAHARLEIFEKSRGAEGGKG